MNGLVCIRFYLDPARDAALLDWLAQQRNRSAAIRQALRAWVQDGPPSNQQHPSLDAATLRAVLREELAHVKILDAPVAGPRAVGKEDGDLQAALDSLVNTWALGSEEKP